MRLQKQRTREVNGKTYHRWTIVVPPEKVKELGWAEGETLEGTVEGENLIVKKNSKKNTKDS